MRSHYLVFVKCFPTQNPLTKGHHKPKVTSFSFLRFSLFEPLKKKLRREPYMMFLSLNPSSLGRKLCLQAEMKRYTANIVDLMKQEKLYASLGGPIILSYVFYH